MAILHHVIGPEVATVDVLPAQKAAVTTSVVELEPAKDEGADTFTHIIDALRAASSLPTEGIISYTSGRAHRFSYNELLEQAEINAAKLVHRFPDKISPGSVVIIHFDNALDNAVFYWSVILTGAIPAVTGPSMFSQNPEDQKKHLEHLYRTLKGPLCLTRKSLLGPFYEQTSAERIETFTAEELDFESTRGKLPHFSPSPSDIAALMLTSGSSGNAKAVPVTHGQALVASRGKRSVERLSVKHRPYLSWVHMDHVASLVQVHISAIVAGISQVHVPPAEIVSDPIQLLNLISRHKVARTFAPNFLLAKLKRQIDAGKTDALDADLSLDGLHLDSGGEANVTEVCVALQEFFSRYGAPQDCLKPGFGMTETCAGAIFNHHCPSYDAAENLEFANLGECMPGIQMRISSIDHEGEQVEPGQKGYLELTGDVVFKGYYNNEKANEESFTSDGWFRTGDLAFLDRNGYLHLDGRSKEIININGVKYLPHEIDSALEQAEIDGAVPSYFCTFGWRDATMDTEVVVVLYLPSYDEADDLARFETQDNIVRIVSTQTQSRPTVIPLRAEDMPKSTLGKLSRGKLKLALTEGKFASLQAQNDQAIQRYREQTRGEPETPEEVIILDIIRQQLEVPPENDYSVNDSIMSLGATSMDLVAIMQNINKHDKLQGGKKIRLIDLLNDPTAKGLAKIMGVSSVKHEYDPVVTLQSHGKKTPLWLVHPGVGEILVFVNLAHRIVDRPVHALRAKGFNAEQGETPFQNLEEVWETYYQAIKKKQPNGPYAIAGYSFGGMIAFEVAKRLEAGGGEVSYTGIWNLPPNIRSRMKQLVWDECVIHLFYFVGLLTEEQARVHKEELCSFDKQGRQLEGIAYLRKHADAARWDELGLSEEYYLNWTKLASAMQGMASDYDPADTTVKCMDVFVADPLTAVAKDRKDWVDNKLSHWKNHVREGVRFHDVQGAHYTMLDPQYVASFTETLRGVLKSRGV
ncbi:putative NRPS-like protein biosynthetic cluster [Cytospora paraplurivora]|uniref:NRPS-like protein biosynthetic cluster n=1 Tax=Cytospora paraplurivora TaxID=2898453 RepID=A0AAN9UHJ3_9PEZI